MVLLSSLLGVAYTFVIGTFIKGVHKIKVIPPKKNIELKTFSIVIALRNEAENLENIFLSLKKLEYDSNKFEIIFVNDHSEDLSFTILKEFKNRRKDLNIQILNNNGIGKKEAVTTGVHKAQFEYILTTDADCIVPSQWIQAYNTLLKKKQYDYITGPVCIQQTSNFLSQFQFIEFLSLQGSTIGSYANSVSFMSNAANSCFSKETFLSLNGYQGNNSVASGDDIFLLEKISKNNSKNIGYLNSSEAIVYTEAEATWKQLYFQKIRWAAKATLYKNKIGIAIGSLVFTMNLILVFLAFYDLRMLSVLFACKFTIDFILIKKTANFFKEELNVGYVIVCSLCYPLFSTGIFIMSQLTSFEWKGRQLKK